ncbi:MAG TPA: hypothetical protein VEB86_12045, partial [Chryseosolibacter sp.]|nr:hypothetical protein [Chryseosolibacter sp.]
YEYMYKGSNDESIFGYRVAERDRLIGDTYVPDDVIVVTGYDYFLNTQEYYDQADEFEFYIDSVKYQTLTEPVSRNLLLTNGSDTITFEAGAMASRLYSKYKEDYNTQIPQEEMTLYGRSRKMDVKMEFDFVNVRVVDDSVTLFSYEGNVFIDVKK